MVMDVTLGGYLIGNDCIRKSGMRQLDGVQTMILRDWIAMAAMFITFASFMFGLYRYFDGRISAIFRRFDEHKKFTDDNFVRVNTCKILHDVNASNTDKLEKRLEKVDEKLDILIRNGNHK